MEKSRYLLTAPDGRTEIVRNKLTADILVKCGWTLTDRVVVTVRPVPQTEREWDSLGWR